MKGNLHLSYLIYQNNQRSLTGLKVEQYKVIEEIGKGAYARVYKALDTNILKLVALKVLDKQILKKSTNNQKIRSKILRNIKAEGQLLHKFNHQNILPIYKIYESDELKILVLQYCRHGNLRQQIQKLGSFTEERAIQVIKQVANGLKALHQHEIIHRDLKPDNIFKHNGKYYIGDFGISKNIAEAGDLHTVCGSYTKAPEVNTSRYTFNADIWSLGVIFLEMIVPEKNFDLKILEKYQKKGNYKIRMPDKTSYLSEKSQLFLQKTLVEDPKQRISSCEQLLQQPIFQIKSQKPKITDSFFTLQSVPSSIQQLNIPSYYESIIIADEFENNDGKIKESQIYQNSFTISKIETKNDFKDYKDEESVVYDKMCEFHLNCKIAQFILFNIIQNIEQYELFNLSSKTTIELMYLLSSRCFFYISNTKYQSTIYNSLIFCEQMQQFSQTELSKIYPIIETRFQKYSSLLTKAESTLKNILKSKLGLSGDSQQTIFEDIEGLSYKKDQQIKLTTQYLNKMKVDFKTARQKMKDSEQAKQFQKYIKTILMKYRQINQLTVDIVEKCGGFQEAIDAIVGNIN